MRLLWLLMTKDAPVAKRRLEQVYRRGLDDDGSVEERLDQSPSKATAANIYALGDHKKVTPYPLPLTISPGPMGRACMHATYAKCVG